MAIYNWYRAFTRHPPFVAPSGSRSALKPPLHRGHRDLEPGD